MNQIQRRLFQPKLYRVYALRPGTAVQSRIHVIDADSTFQAACKLRDRLNLAEGDIIAFQVYSIRYKLHPYGALREEGRR